MTVSASQMDETVVGFVRRHGLVAPHEEPAFTPLTGGVSSDIWLVEAGGRRFCVKRAMPKLRVAAEWNAPIARNAFESAWLKGVAAISASSVPAVLADEPEAGILAMEYLPPEDFRLWKAELLAGRVDLAVAKSVGERLGRIHSAFARDTGAPARFASDDIFLAIRIEPYLAATAAAHPALANRIDEIIRRTRTTRLSVVHGDISPKNILIGQAGPVFLDAECAWFGDPAFDIAFCLNHLLLKCLAVPAASDRLLHAFDMLARCYLARVDWEDADRLEERAAALLPVLFLARVDGKSPVEYVVRDIDRDAVRRVAALHIENPPRRLAAVKKAWSVEIAHRNGDRK